MKTLQTVSLVALLGTSAPVQSLTLWPNPTDNEIPLCHAQDIYHTVQQGDSLEKIARLYNHDKVLGYFNSKQMYLPSVLASENKIKLNATIKLGEKLKIPWKSLKCYGAPYL